VKARIGKLIGTALVASLAFIAARGQEPDLGFRADEARFATVEVFVASSEPLAAWQFELAERSGRMTVVGVENGDSDAFGDAPYYDLDTVQRGAAERIVVADFSLSDAASLPVGRTRVATVHVRLMGSAAPDYEVRLVAAGNSAGEPIDAAISLGRQ
jgi:hypothetical protein